MIFLAKKKPRKVNEDVYFSDVGEHIHLESGKKRKLHIKFGKGSVDND